MVSGEWGVGSGEWGTYLHTGYGILKSKKWQI